VIAVQIGMIAAIHATRRHRSPTAARRPL